MKMELTKWIFVFQWSANNRRNSSTSIIKRKLNRVIIVGNLHGIWFGGESFEIKWLVVKTDGIFFLNCNQINFIWISSLKSFLPTKATGLCLFPVLQITSELPDLAFETLSGKIIGLSVVVEVFLWCRKPLS